MSDDSSTPPQFGLLDVIEAFTAMRHEYRNQTKESRDVAEGLNTTTTKIDEFTDRFEKATRELQASVASSLNNGSNKTSNSASSSDSAGEGKKQAARFAVNLAEIDHLVSRSVDAATRVLSPARVDSEAAETVSATDRLGSLGPIARFFCRQFAQQLDRDLAADANRRDELRQASLAAVTSGLSMTADHLRRRVADQDIERIDVIGKPFDGNLMRAVEVVESTDVPPGHVAEQLSPAYRFDGRVILYADVRLARPQ